MFTLYRTAFFVSGLLLSSCGVTYNSPSVSASDTEFEVSVLNMTAAEVTRANSTSYKPQPLPAEFSQTISSTEFGVAPNSPIQRSPAGRIIFRRPPQIEHTSYVIGIGDVILLATRSGDQTVEQLTGLLAAENQRQGYTVRDDGAIAIPDVGAVRVQGLTIEEAEERVFQRLVENRLDPEFSLEISEFNSKRVSIAGNVGKSQLLPIALNPLYLDEAIAQAGGLNIEDPIFGAIQIHRKGELYQIPVEAYYKDSSARRILLADGDSIFVTTEIRARSNELSERRANFQTKLELGAIKQDFVYFAGEVSQQNRIALPFEIRASLADLFYQNGGFPSASGNPSHIYVLRVKDAENLTAYHLDAKNVVNMAMATKFEMRPDDIIFVREQPITVWGRALQQAFSPLLGAGIARLNE